MQEVQSFKAILTNYIWKSHSLFANTLLNKVPSDQIEALILSQNKINDIVSLCKKDEKIALFVLKNECLRNKLGKYDHDILFKLNEHNYTGQADVNSTAYKLNSGEFLFEVCNAHRTTKQYALDNRKIFQKILSPGHFIDIYEKNINIRACTSHFTF